MCIYISEGNKKKNGGISMNRLTVVGRIVREVTLKQVGEDRIVLNNVIAVQRLFKSENGQEADFIPFVVWSKKATLIEEYCDKGDLIGLDGRLQSRSYEDDSGERQYVIEMNVDHVQFLQPKKDKTTDF